MANAKRGVRGNNNLFKNRSALGSGMNSNLTSVDDIGVLVVDGDFDLYGRILFGNKQILQLLGYKAE